MQVRPYMCHPDVLIWMEESTQNLLEVAIDPRCPDAWLTIGGTGVDGDAQIGNYTYAFPVRSGAELSVA